MRITGHKTRDIGDRYQREAWDDNVHAGVEGLAGRYSAPGGSTEIGQTQTQRART